METFSVGFGVPNHLMNTLRKILVLVLLATSGLALAGCKEKPPLEKAADAIGDAAKDAADATKKAADKAVDAVKDATN